MTLYILHGESYVCEWCPLCIWVFAHGVSSVCEHVHVIYCVSHIWEYVSSVWAHTCDVLCHLYVRVCVMRDVFNVWACAHDMIYSVCEHMCQISLHVFLAMYVSGLIFLCPVVASLPPHLYSWIFRQTSSHQYHEAVSHFICLWVATESAHWSAQNPDMPAELPLLKVPSKSIGEWYIQ